MEAGWRPMPLPRARRPRADMVQNMSADITQILTRVGERLGAHPARDVAFWLACIPFVLPAPLIAGIVAIRAFAKGAPDARWKLVISIAAINFILSAMAIAGALMLLGDWMIARLDELPWIFLFWLSGPQAREVPV